MKFKVGKIVLLSLALSVSLYGMSGFLEPRQLIAHAVEAFTQTIHILELKDKYEHLSPNEKIVKAISLALSTLNIRTFRLMPTSFVPWKGCTSIVTPEGGLNLR
jgi:hypothetical protein